MIPISNTPTETAQKTVHTKGELKQMPADSDPIWTVATIVEVRVKRTIDQKMTADYV